MGWKFKKSFKKSKKRGEYSIMGNKNQLTNRQKEFAKYIVEGIYSNSKCARLSGYAKIVLMSKHLNYWMENLSL